LPVDPLPAQLQEIPLEYFQRALAVLREHGSQRIVVLGTSKGAEAVLLLASTDSLISAVIGYMPSHVVWSCICSQPLSSWLHNGVGVPFVPPGGNPAYRPPPDFPLRPTINYEYRLQNETAVRAAEIPVERIRGPVLLIAGGRDGLWPSAFMARRIADRRARFDKRLRTNVLIYPDAGHLIGKAYLPAGAPAIGRLDSGGTAGANAHAQSDSWPEVLDFLAGLR
jgi:dienelactone hydrolase